ncbi:MAG: hypothetical protein EDS66_09515 [Planctomycetota bacterium]|nr:MAG: hypothetical protein EDS66_09515 [Planctomycetota bacterium]MCQ3922019.1 hypothetical protein [Planctomycetota bacterium]
MAILLRNPRTARPPGFRSRRDARLRERLPAHPRIGRNADGDLRTRLQPDFLVQGDHEARDVRGSEDRPFNRRRG